VLKGASVVVNISERNASYAGAEVSEKTNTPSGQWRTTRRNPFRNFGHSFRSTKGCVKIGCDPNRNSCGTTLKGKGPTHTHDEVKWRR
jgi:hypothetical protein